MKKIFLLILLMSCNKIIKLDNRNKDINGELLLAIENEDENKVKELIDEGADINYISGGKTLLDIAIDKANIEIIYLLLKNDVNVDNQDRIIKIYNLALSDFSYKTIDIMIEKGYKIKEGMVDNNKYFLLLCYISNAKELENFIKNNNIVPQEVRDEGDVNGLIIASYRGNLEIVKLLLNYKIKVNSSTIYNSTSLMSASEMGHKEIVRLLIEEGANVNDKNEDNLTSLMLAIQNGHIEVVRLLLQREANINDENDDGWTALTLASNNSDVEIVKLLLERGVNINDEEDVWAALMIALQKGHKEIVRLLLEREVNINDENDNGWTALMLASNNGDIEIVKLLIEKGADVSHIGQNEFTALALASRKAHIEIVKLLIEKGANINDIGKDEFAALVSASKKDHKEMMELLFEKEFMIREELTENMENFLVSSANFGYRKGVELALGKDVDVNCRVWIRNKGYKTPLILASNNGHIEIARLLLEREVDVNHTESDSRTPLILASMNGHTEVVKLLIKRGAKIDELDCLGYTALMSASEKGHKKIAEMLIEEGTNLDTSSDKYDLTALLLALSNGHIEIAKLLIEKGADLDRVAYKGSHALNLAIEGEYKEIAKLLIEKGANINNKDHQGDTALIVASQKGCKDLVEILLEKGADIYETNNDGSIALMDAIEFDCKEIVEFLLENGNHVEDTNDDELTTLMLASKYGNKEIIELLLNKGACINKRNYMDLSALIMALRYQRLGVIKLLLNRGALIPEYLGELKILIETLTKDNKGNFIEEKIQKDLLEELLYLDGKLDIKNLLLISKGALNFSEEALVKNIIENINIADIYFLDNFTFSAKSLLVDCFLYLSDSFKLVKANDISKIKGLIIESFIEYYKGKDNSAEEYEQKFISSNNSIRNKIAALIAKIENVLSNFNYKEFTNEELVEVLNNEDDKY